MVKFRSASVVLLSCSVLFAGCHKGPANGVVATVNGHAINQSDVDKVYTAQLANNPQQQTPSKDQADATKLQILQELITREMIEQRAAKLNLVASSDEVDSKFKELKAPYTDETFQAKLKANGQTVDELRSEIQHSLTASKLLNREINSKITVTDAEVNAYFNAHKTEYNFLENQFHLAQIIVAIGPAGKGTGIQDSKALSDADARKKIQAIKNQLDAGADFGTLAMNFSDNPQTQMNGGDMGMIPESQLRGNPALAAAIEKLHPGQDSDIIPFPDPTDPKRPGGYAIFRLLEKTAAGQRDLSDPRVLQSIRQQLHDMRAQLLKAAYFETLRDQAKVQNFLAEEIYREDAK